MQTVSLEAYFGTLLKIFGLLRILFEDHFARAAPDDAKVLIAAISDMKDDGLEHHPSCCAVYGTGFNLECTCIAWVEDADKTMQSETTFAMHTLKKL